MMKVVVISCHIKSYAHQLYVKLCDFLKNKEAGMNVFPKKKESHRNCDIDSWVLEPIIP
jgi:hypothetical protein